MVFGSFILSRAVLPLLVLRPLRRPHLQHVLRHFLGRERDVWNWLLVRRKFWRLALGRLSLILALGRPALRWALRILPVQLSASVGAVAALGRTIAPARPMVLFRWREVPLAAELAGHIFSSPGFSIVSQSSQYPDRQNRWRSHPQLWQSQQSGYRI